MSLYAKIVTQLRAAHAANTRISPQHVAESVGAARAYVQRVASDLNLTRVLLRKGETGEHKGKAATPSGILKPRALKNREAEYVVTARSLIAAGITPGTTLKFKAESGRIVLEAV